ncbi:Signal recognition particle subunit SRP68 [Holothuria leucospilota]|uniref:Signal recognition particle subunit SRP68 n=1 Tax=Holothuria leucospilota TaxID=206669 RepID=A0A9Q1C3F0_HOLLE|nr:Signal recognition particle subunit SRP68 [Holothuria leucospilota]
MAEDEAITPKENISPDEKPKEIQETISLEVLKIIKDSQQRHGLRHKDYQRYRSYCTRRLQRIRKSLKFVQRNRNKFAKKVVTDEVLTDVKFLYIPLVSAEGAWSYAMQLKQEANSERRKGFHVITRLKKALKHAEELEALCESDKCDARSKLESQAYHLWIKGSLYFETEEWENCMDAFKSASNIYEKLASAVTEDQRVLYLERVNDIVPNLRYCAFQFGDESAIQDLRELRGKGGEMSTNIDFLLQQTREKQAKTLSEVYWRGRTMPVTNERVRTFLLSNKESEQELAAATDNEAKISIYENSLMECKDALQTLRDELKTDPNWKRGQQTGEDVSSNQYLHTYLTYIRLTRTIERNILLVESLKERLPGSLAETKLEQGQKKTKPQDLIRMYDTIIQSLGEIPQLPGVEDDEDLQQEVTAKTYKFKAYRCFYLAQSYSQAKKWKEAAALFERAMHHVERSTDEWQSVNNGPIQAEIQELETLAEEINGLKYSAQASSILDSSDMSITKGMAQLKLKDKRPLEERLHQYSSNQPEVASKPNFTTFPPDFKPSPCKPLFFDIALNHVEFPSLEQKLEQKKTASAGGIGGFLRGWWGGGSS